MRRITILTFRFSLLPMLWLFKFYLFKISFKIKKNHFPWKIEWLNGDGGPMSLRKCFKNPSSCRLILVASSGGVSSVFCNGSTSWWRVDRSGGFDQNRTVYCAPVRRLPCRPFFWQVRRQLVCLSLVVTGQLKEPSRDVCTRLLLQVDAAGKDGRVCNHSRTTRIQSSRLNLRSEYRTRRVSSLTDWLTDWATRNKEPTDEMEGE